MIEHRSHIIISFSEVEPGVTVQHVAVSSSMLLPQEQLPPENTLQTSLGEGLFAAKALDDINEHEISAMVNCCTSRQG